MIGDPDDQCPDYWSSTVVTSVVGMFVILQIKAQSLRCLMHVLCSVADL